jgi:hypothetical protein
MATKGHTPTERREDFSAVDKYPKLKKILAELVQADDIPDVPIERLELTTLANGDATYRYWEARAEESEGGFIPGA